MRFALTTGIARRVLSRAATAHAAGVLAKEHAECHKAGFRATPYGLTLDGRRVPKGSADWLTFEAGRARAGRDREAQANDASAPRRPVVVKWVSGARIARTYNEFSPNRLLTNHEAAKPTATSIRRIGSAVGRLIRRDTHWFTQGPSARYREPRVKSGRHASVALRVGQLATTTPYFTEDSNALGGVRRMRAPLQATSTTYPE